MELHPPILRIEGDHEILQKAKSEVADGKVEEVETRIRQRTRLIETAHPHPMSV
jgi:hypothetical protein